MAFSPSRKEASDFNGGERYRNHIDSPSAEDFNNVIEGLLKGQKDIEQNSMAIEFVGGVADALSDSNQYLLKNVSKISDGLSVVEKRVDNLYARTFPEIDVIDNAVAYSKVVPEGALPYAEVAKVGGMSYKSENRIPYPYNETTKTVNGITFTDNGDGSITINGTCTEEGASFNFGRFQVTPGRDYFLKVLPIIGGFGSIYAYVYTDTDDEISDVGYGTKFTPNGAYAISSMVVRPGNTFNNLVIRPMLNQGTTAKPYSPYFEGLRHAKVMAVKSEIPNLFTSENFLYGVTDGGATTGLFRAISQPITLNNPMYVRAKGNANVEGFRYEIHLYSGTLYSTPVWLSGWIEDTEPHRVPVVEYSSATELRILVGSKAETTVTKEIIDRLEIEVYYGETPPKYLGTLPIPSAVQALPDYGLGVSATANNHVDWSERKYHRTCGVVDLSTLTWEYVAGGATRFQTTSLITAKESTSDAVVANIVCGKYSTGSANALYVGEAGICMSGAMLWVYDTTFGDDVTAFKAAMSGVMLVYELATPEVTDISHLLPEDNFIPVEAGGQIVAENEYSLAAPTTINYQIN